MHPKLLKRWRKEENACKRLRKITEERVVRWEYWTGYHWHWKPSEYESVEKTAKRTTREKAWYTYSYDAQDRVIVIKFGFPGDENPTPEEEFLSYSRDSIQSTKYYEEQLRDVAEATLVNGRITRVESGDGWDSIQWRGDKIARIQFGEHRKKPVLEWCYDESGKRTGMYDLPRKLKLPKGVTIASLAKSIHAHLTQLVPKIVAKAGIKQLVYCLALAYDGEGNGVVPPSLAIGLDSERQNWIRTKRKAAKEFIWNPEEFRQHETKKTSLPDDKKFERACEWYNQLLDRKGSDKPARELLNQVARDLAKLDWNGRLNTTDDFVVFAVDYEGGDLKKNLVKSVPPRILSRLKAAKFL
jgi:hypothetical protein